MTQTLAPPRDSARYARLAMPFNVTFRELRGGVELEYITGEQVTTRLNQELGFLGWAYRVREHGIRADADECWVLGELTVTVDATTVTRQQFGSQKIKRSRSSGQPLDLGFDLKGAATDALKKCASLVGVGLYLWKKEPQAGAGPFPRGQGASTLACEQCGAELTETRFKDGDRWGPAQLAANGRRKHRRVLCMTHYREANQEARRRGEALVAGPI